MFICDVCGQERSEARDGHPRSRCYSCETAEGPWRSAISRQIVEEFLPAATLDEQILIEGILATIATPLPPARPTRMLQRSMLEETVEALALEAGPIHDQPGLVTSDDMDAPAGDVIVGVVLDKDISNG